MIAVTIREARARLNRLIEQARRGEQVVLLRGSRHVACLTPIDADDIEVRTSPTDAQAERLWQEVARLRGNGRLRTFSSPRAAVAHLRKNTGRRRRR